MLGTVISIVALAIIGWILHLYHRISSLESDYKSQRTQVLKLYQNIDAIEEWIKYMRETNLKHKDHVIFLYDSRRENNGLTISLSGKYDGVPEISKERREKLRKEFDWLNPDWYGKYTKWKKEIDEINENRTDNPYE